MVNQFDKTIGSCHELKNDGQAPYDLTLQTTTLNKYPSDNCSFRGQLGPLCLYLHKENETAEINQTT